MLWLSAALTALIFVAVLLVSGNNLSACVGPAIGARIISKRFGILLGAVGFSVGLIAQGATMAGTVKSCCQMPLCSLGLRLCLVAIIIFVIADVIRVPMSLSMSLVGMLAGLSVASGILVNGGYVAEVVALWVAAPLIAIFFAFYLLKLLDKGWSKNIWRRLRVYKVLLIVLAFTTSYVLGANTLGLIVATGGFSLTAELVAVVAVFIGTFFLSAGEIRRVSQELFLMRYPNATVTLVTSTVLVEAATLVKIPLSNTQALSASVFGAGVSYKNKFVSAPTVSFDSVKLDCCSATEFYLGFIIGPHLIYFDWDLNAIDFYFSGFL